MKHAVDTITWETKSRTSSRDALGAVLSLDRKTRRVGIAVGVLGATLLYAPPIQKAATSLFEMQQAMQAVRVDTREYLNAIDQRDIEVSKEEPPLPEPEQAAPKPLIVPLSKDDPYDTDVKEQPADKPAEAGKTLTSDEPVADFTNQAFASGNGDGTWGQVSTNGKGNRPVTNAHPDGVDGGQGKGPGTALPDLSKAPGLVGGTSWNCPFPSEADQDGVDSAEATIIVTVKPDGSAATVRISGESSTGFGREARRCALARRYTPGFDKAGNAITATTAPIRVRFNR